MVWILFSELRKDAVEEFFDPVKEISGELAVKENPEYCSAWIILDFRRTIIMNKVIIQKGMKNRKFVKVINTVRGEWLTVACCCVCVPPAVISRCARIPESHKQNFAALSTTQMTESGYVNETAFLEYLQHFKNRCSWKIPHCVVWTCASLRSRSSELLST